MIFTVIISCATAVCPLSHAMSGRIVAKDEKACVQIATDLANRYGVGNALTFKCKAVK